MHCWFDRESIQLGKGSVEELAPPSLADATTLLTDPGPEEKQLRSSRWTSNVRTFPNGSLLANRVVCSRMAAVRHVTSPLKMRRLNWPNQGSGPRRLAAMDCFEFHLFIIASVTAASRQLGGIAERDIRTHYVKAQQVVAPREATGKRGYTRSSPGEVVA